LVAAAVLVNVQQGDLFGESASAPTPDLARDGVLCVFRAGDQLAAEHSRRRIFGDCPTCGAFVPEPCPWDGGLAVRYRSDVRGGYRADRFWLLCPACKTWSRGRAVALRTPTKPTAGIVRAGRAYCNGACLNGRRSCDCMLCRGRCHGAQTCPGH
jgi:hypothetical protein